MTTRAHRMVHVAAFVVAVIVAVVAISVAGGFSYPALYQHNLNGPREGWTITYAGHSYSKSIPCTLFPVKPGDTVVIEGVLPRTYAKDTTIRFKTSYQWVKVYIDEQLIYSTEPVTKSLFIGSGILTHVVEYPSALEIRSAPIRIELLNAAPMRSVDINQIYFGEKADTILAVALPDVPALIALGLLMTVGLICIVTLPFGPGRRDSRNVYPWFGALILCAGMISLLNGNLPAVQLAIENPAFAATVHILAVFLMPHFLGAFTRAYFGAETWEGAQAALVLETTAFIALIVSLALRLDAVYPWAVGIFLLLVLVSVLAHLIPVVRAYKASAPKRVLPALSLAVFYGLVLIEVASYATPWAASFNVFPIGLVVFSALVGYDIAIQTVNNRTKQARQELSLEQQRYQVVFSHAADLLFDWDVLLGKVHWSNPQSALFGGKLPSEGFPWSISSKLAPSSAGTQFEEMCQDVVEKAQRKDLMLHYTLENQSEYWITIAAYPILDTVGEVVSVTGRVVDETERIRLARALNKERSLRQAGEDLFDAVFEADITNNTVQGQGAQRILEATGIDFNVSYDDFLAVMATQYVDPEFTEAYLELCNREHLKKDFAQDKTMFELELRFKFDRDKYEWAKVYCRLYFDDVAQGIRMVSFVDRTEDERSKEVELLEMVEHNRNRRLAEAGLFDKVYEVDLTHNMAWGAPVEDLLMSEVMDKYEGSFTYEQFIDVACATKVHPEFVNGFLEHFGLEQLKHRYNEGANSVEFEGRMRLASDEYVWARVLASLYLDTSIDSVMATVYILNIETEKQKELELIDRSQRDSLTGLYNKSATKELVTHALGLRQLQKQSHALFMIDIDDFKDINDNLGHSFGDVVLTEIAEKLRPQFRTSDIIGRVGGDEFMVFMLDVPTMDKVKEKAQQICETFRQRFVDVKGNQHIISASVGVCLVEAGQEVSFDELYHAADSALYRSKQEGKNRYVIVAGDTLLDSKRSPFSELDRDFREHLFGDNVSIHILEILSQSLDVQDAVEEVLSLLGKQFKFSRAYVLCCDDNPHYHAAINDWTDSEVREDRVLFRKPSCQDLLGLGDYYDHQGALYMPSVDCAPDALRAYAAHHEIASTFQCAIMEGNTPRGFIVFERFTDEMRRLSNQDVDILTMATRIVGSYLLTNRISRMLADRHRSLAEILDALTTIAMVVDGTSFEILFANKSAYEALGESLENRTCYEVINENCTSCVADCPITTAKRTGSNHESKVIHVSKLGEWVELTATQIEWDGSSDRYFINITDISDYIGQ